MGCAGYRNKGPNLALVVLDDHLHWRLIADSSASVSGLVSGVKLGVIQRRRSARLGWKRLWQPHFSFCDLRASAPRREKPELAGF